MIVRLIIIIISLGGILNSFLNDKTPIRKLANVTIWLLVAYLSLFPKTSHQISYFWGFGDNLNTLIFLGFVIVFILIQRQSRIQEKLESKIIKIAQNQATADFTPKNE